MPLRIPVTAIVGCPYHVINKLYTKEIEYAIKIGRNRHDEIQNKLKDMGYEIEVPIEISIGDVVIAGRIDVLDRKNKKVYEIKSFNISNKGFKQLLLYRDMLYIKEMTEYKPGLILYKGGRVVFVNQFLVVPPLFTMWNYARKVVQAIKELGDIPRIACEDCRYCILRNECRPHYRVFRDKIIKVY